MIKASYLMTSWTFSDFWTEIVSGMLSNMSNIDLDKVVESLSKVRDSKIIKQLTFNVMRRPWDIQKAYFWPKMVTSKKTVQCVLFLWSFKNSILFWKRYFLEVYIFQQKSRFNVSIKNSNSWVVENYYHE